MKRTYPGIDLLKYVFACLIPLLHIPFGAGTPVFLQQYLARMGVPFFFASSGFFLSRSLEKRGPKEAALHHAKRVGKLLGIWFLIYSPIFFVTLRNAPNPIGNLLFLTPGYLWYLTALLVAGVLFCCFRNRKLLWGLAVGLYLFGTFFGGSWTWLTGGIPAYTEVFLTTRNGLFFGLPMLCVGELAGRFPSKSLKSDLIGAAVSVVALWVEIFFMLKRVVPGADHSLYLLLPVSTFYLLRLAMHIAMDRSTACLRDAGVAVYVMQFGIITALNILRPYTGLAPELYGWVTWLFVIVCASACGILFVKNKYLKHLFR